MTDVRDPDRYAHGHHASVLRSHRWRTAENSAAYLLPHLRPRDRLLDVGMGPGTITVDLAERLSEGWVTGIDSAETAVVATRELAAERGAGRITAEVGNVYALAYADDSFDVAHAHQVLQHLSDPVAALIEMRRVVRSGGVVAARDADYAAMTWYPTDPAAGPLARALPPGRPGRRWRTGRGAPDAAVGPASRLRRGHLQRLHLVLRQPGGRRLVVPDLGRARRPLRLRHPGGGGGSSPTRPSWTSWPPVGGGGAINRTPGSPSCTASSWPRSPDRRRRTTVRHSAARSGPRLRSRTRRTRLRGASGECPKRAAAELSTLCLKVPLVFAP